MEENEECDLRYVNVPRTSDSILPSQTTLRPYTPIKYIKPDGENVLRVRMSTYIPANLGEWLEVNLIQIVVFILNTEHPIYMPSCFVKISYTTTAMWVLSLARISSKVKTLFYDRVFLSTQTCKLYKQMVEQKWRGNIFSLFCDTHYEGISMERERRFCTSLKDWGEMVKRRYWSRFTKVIRHRSAKNIMAVQLPHCRTLKERIAAHEQQQEAERIAIRNELYPNATCLPHCDVNNVKSKRLKFGGGGGGGGTYVAPKCTDAFFKRHNNNPHDQRKRRRTEENEKRLESVDQRRKVRARIIDEMWDKLSKEEQLHYEMMSWDVNPDNMATLFHDFTPYFDEERGIIML